jgi:large subunit ribosomal protein L6
MSRIGNKPIPVPSNTKVKVDGQQVTAEGPHGKLSVEVKTAISVELKDGKILVSNATGGKDDKKYHGLYRSLINNIVIGVSEGFTRKLELVGVGYRASVDGKDVVLEVGYSNPKRVRIPDGVKASVDKNVTITIWGIDKERIGQFAADIRHVRPPEPYKGKGIRYENEVVRRKAGKTGAVGKGGT